MFYAANGLLIQAESKEEALKEYNLHDRVQDTGKPSVLIYDSFKAFEDITIDDIQELGTDLFEVLLDYFEEISKTTDSPIQRVKTTCGAEVPKISFLHDRYGDEICLTVEEYDRLSIFSIVVIFEFNSHITFRDRFVIDYSDNVEKMLLKTIMALVFGQ